MNSLKLKSGFPVIWGDLAYQNQWLKRVALLACLVSMLSLTVAAVLAKRKPQVLVMDPQANIVPVSGQVPIEVEAEKAVRRYVELRYVWQPDTQAKTLPLAKGFVAPTSTKAFDKTVTELVAFSKGRNVAQRVYPTTIIADGKTSRVQVVADRFTEIQGLKAATILRVILTYQTGPRTDANPWGIYIVKEEELQ